MPYPWQREFWPASFAERCRREREELHRRECVIAEMVLAGWKFTEVQINPTEAPYEGRLVYETFSPDGNYHGINHDRWKAADYAKWSMAQKDANTAIVKNIVNGIHCQQTIHHRPLSTFNGRHTGQMKSSVHGSGRGDKLWRAI